METASATRPAGEAGPAPPVKVLYFHQHFSTPSGTGGTRSYAFARRLVERGHEVTVVCGNYGDPGFELARPPGGGDREGVVDGIRILQFDLPYRNQDGFARRTWTFLRYAGRSASAALQRDYDIVFATSTPLTAGLPGIFARHLRHKPFVFEVRDLWPELPRAMGVIRNPLVLGALSLLERVCYRSADALIALAPGIVEGIRARDPARRPVALIPNGCDLELFHPGQRADLDLPGVAPGNFVAVFAGTHGIANGLGAVLDAAAELKKRGRTDIDIAFIGEGRCKDDLVRRARRERLANCHFYDPMPKKWLARVLGAAGAGLMVLDDVPAFYRGTSPNKYFDYLAAGLPVVNNYPGWLAEMITAQGCGIAVPPGDPAAFADALEKLADDPRGRAWMSREARLLGQRSFSREALAEEFVAWLELALERSRRSAGATADPRAAP